MTEEEAQDKTFIVYPFTTHNDEEVQKVIEKIKQSRVDSSTKTNSESLQEQYIFEQTYIPVKTEEVQIEEQQGPILKKTLNPKINKNTK